MNTDMAGPITKPGKVHTKKASSTSVGSHGSENIKEWSLQRFTSVREKDESGDARTTQSSESPLDPLNWSPWKREFAFSSLCFSAGVAAILKNIFITSNAVLATEGGSSYMATVALTGVPLIISGVLGPVYTMSAALVGKRVLYLTSSIFMLAGAVWNMHVLQKYKLFMISRILQALGWAAFDSLVQLSIHDMFLAHQRKPRRQIYNMVVLFFTWNPPILVGYVSQSANGSRNALMITNVIQVFSLVLLILGAPETSFDRSVFAPRPRSVLRPGLSTTISASARPSSKFKIYLHSLHPMPYIIHPKAAELLTPIRSIAAPSNLLAFLLTGPLLATTQGVAFSVSLIFSQLPVFLFPERLGYLFILPAVLSLLFYGSCWLGARVRNRLPRSTVASMNSSLLGITLATIVGVVGLLVFGIYTQMHMFKFNSNISLRVVSLLLGILISGSTVLAYYISTYIEVISNRYTSLAHSDSSFITAHATLQNLLSGVFTFALPMWISPQRNVITGLKNVVIAMAIIQIVLTSTVAALLWVKGEEISKYDGKVLGRVSSEEDDDMSELLKWKTSTGILEA